MDRQDYQDNAVKLCLKERKVALQWATSLGKSKVGIDMLHHLSLIGKKKFLIVVAERAHISNWENEFTKWNYKGIKPLMICYASLHKIINTSWDIIIFDEAHHLGSPKRMLSIRKINSEYMLFLSATLGDDLLVNLRNLYGHIYSQRVKLDTAINEGILPHPNIILVPLDLNTEKLSYTYKDSRTKLSVRCSERGFYDHINRTMDKFKNIYYTTGQKYYKNLWMNEGSARKRFLGEIKTAAAKEFIKDNLEGKRYICFCTSIKQVKELGGNTCIHSKMSDTQSVIDGFNSGKTSSLYAVGMLQEGQNLTGIEAELIIQLDGKERSFIQKSGRAMRAESPLIYIMYCRNTQDEVYLKNVIDNIELKYIKIFGDENNDK